MENVKYYVKRLLEQPESKFIFAFFGTVLSAMFGEFTAPMRAFLILLVADFITGVYKSWKKKRLSSWFSRKGWGKLATYAVVISLGHLVQQVGITGMRDFVLLWAGATEGISVLENFDELGIEIPAFLKDKLLQTKEKKFGG